MANSCRFRLANQDRDGSFEAARDFRIRIGNPIVEDSAGRRGSDASGFDIVLQRDGNTVQGTAQLAGALLGFEFSRLGQGLLAHDGDERVAAFAVVGGWQVNGLLVLYSGSPFTVTATDTLLLPGSNQPADQVKPRCGFWAIRSPISIRWLYFGDRRPLRHVGR